MKSVTLAALLCCLWPPSLLFTQDLYDQNVVTRIDIAFKESNWAEILDQYYFEGQERRLAETVTINGVRFDSAGVRFKGNSSYWASQTKKPFNIELDYVRDADYQGYETLKLSNGFADPSLVREVLSYEILRKYMPASRSNYAAMYINGTYYGLYSSTQSVDKSFYRTHYYSGDNARFKCNSEIMIPSNGGCALNYLGEDSILYYPYYELKSDFGWKQLVDVARALKNTPGRFEELIDLDRAIWMLAFNSVFVNLDSYTGSRGQNYYLYRDNAGRFSTVVWDLNMSFGSFTSIGTNSHVPLGKMQLIQLDPLYGKNESSRPLMKIILSDSVYRRKYIAHCRTLINENISNGWYLDRAQELQAIIDTLVKNDPNKSYTHANMAANLTSTVQGGGMGGVIGVSELLDARAQWLKSQPLFTAVPPAIDDIAAAERGGSLAVQARIQTAQSATLHYRKNLGDPFIAVAMRDDGMEPDATAGDGLYSAAAPLAGTTQYYIYAENMQAGIYSPERAEHDYYEFTPQSAPGIVINEFMADNDGTQTDQDGDYDDWLELYNTTDADVPLEGYFLTDDQSKPAKWTFPSVSIPAKGYLIVWCDEDDGQQGLHASFKLSASGEYLRLSAPDTVLIDEVSFAAQITDTSTGRYPNGTGPFVLMPPTFNAENAPGIVSAERAPVALTEQLGANYPNPFNPSTSIPVTMPSAGFAELSVRSMHGSTVAVLHSGQLAGGRHVFYWNALNDPAGMYLCTLRTSSGTTIRKMMLVK